MSDRNGTPLVAKLAAQYGVNLAQVTGTGVGGRVRKDDVLAAAGVVSPKPPGAARSVAPRSPFASNPLVARARASTAAAGTPASAAPAPSLFQTGDLPPFTASGIDPETLLQVPAAARHPMARAATPSEAYAIMEMYSSGPNAEAAAANDFQFDDGNLDYESRVIKWSGATDSGSGLDVNGLPVNPWMPGSTSLANG